MLFSYFFCMKRPWRSDCMDHNLRLRQQLWAKTGNGSTQTQILCRVQAFLKPLKTTLHCIVISPGSRADLVETKNAFEGIGSTTRTINTIWETHDLVSKFVYVNTTHLPLLRRITTIIDAQAFGTTLKRV